MIGKTKLFELTNEKDPTQDKPTFISLYSFYQVI